MGILKRVSLSRIFLVICFIIFCLLIYKDPFSQRSLIPNLEPVPDTFHYIIPARNLIKGEGFSLSREGRVVRSQITSIYSLSLIPFYLLNEDPRMFYFANIMMALLGFLIFYRILAKITNNHWIILIGLLLYSTNYDLYWFPTLAMAENLMILLFLTAVYLILLSPNLKNLILATVIALSFYMTKYASAPLTITYILIYGLKVFTLKQEKKLTRIFIVIICLLIGVTFFYLYFFKHMNVFTTLFYYFNGIIFHSTPTQIFSSTHISFNLPRYIDALLGNPTRVLWDQTPLVPKIVGMLGLTGLFIGLTKNNTRFLSLSLIILLSGSIIFMSTFYSFDARYILHAIPVLILGLIVFLTLVFNLTSKKGFNKIFYLGLFLFIGWYVLSSGLRLKNQIMLNLKYAETPWYYVSVLKLNEYFNGIVVDDRKKPIVISAMPPFLIDMYSNNKYSLLPLSYDQEFRDAKEIVWGPNDYSDLLKLYTKYINEGYPVYVSRYGLGNESYTNRDFQIITEKFKLTKVLTGCYEQCNIYRVELKD